MKTKMKSVVLAIGLLLGLSVVAVAQKKSATVVLTADVTCESCKAKIEKNMAYEKGVKAVDADIEKDIVTISYKVGKNDAESLSAALKKLGYENTISSSSDTTKACCKKGKDQCKKAEKASCSGDSTKCKKAEGKACCKGEKKGCCKDKKKEDCHKDGVKAE